MASRGRGGLGVAGTHYAIALRMSRDLLRVRILLLPFECLVICSSHYLCAHLFVLYLISWHHRKRGAWWEAA